MILKIYFVFFFEKNILNLFFQINSHVDFLFTYCTLVQGAGHY